MMQGYIVNTTKPKRLYSIALPESTTDKHVHDYFYNSNGTFRGFHVTKNVEQTFDYVKFFKRINS